MSGFILPINNALQYFTDQGVILEGGLIYTYTAGTTTPVATYTDSTLGVENANPIELDSYGRLPNGVWVSGGQLTKVVVKDADGVAIGPTLDFLPGINDLTASQGGENDGASNIGTEQGISVQDALDNLRDDQPSWCGTATGSADALALTPSPAKLAYVAGQEFWFIAANNNTGATTANVSGLGAISVKKNGSAGLVALTVGDIRTGDVYVLKASSASQLVLANPSAVAAAAVSVQGSWGAKGLVCYNTVATPNTKIDLTASQITVWSPSDGGTVTLTSPATKTNDTGAASPAADARDQGAAFTDPSFIHFYWIYKSSDGTLSSISSAVAPPTGPTLPTGYTHWAYVGAVRYVAGALKSVRFLGDRCYYNAYSSASISGLTATSETTTSLATIVPTNALDIHLGLLLELVTTAGGAETGTFLIKLATGVTYGIYIIRVPAASQTLDYVTNFPLPVVAATPQFIYIWSFGGANASTYTATVNVYSYRVPNGAS